MAAKLSNQIIEDEFTLTQSKIGISELINDDRILAPSNKSPPGRRKMNNKASFGSNKKSSDSKKSQRDRSFGSKHSSPGIQPPQYRKDTELIEANSSEEADSEKFHGGGQIMMMKQN